jgi:hypothetical protein
MTLPTQWMLRSNLASQKSKLSFAAFIAVALFGMWQPASAAPTTGTTTVALDDGSRINVDYADYAPVDGSLNSILAPNIIQTLVLAADRSTRTGCPYFASKKGLFRTGDRIFITNKYLAWFDYTLADGIGTTSWSRSGGIAGYWSLDPNKSDYASVTFRHFYDSAHSVSSDTPNANGLCWNWARNELIPGSDSPLGGVYWWDAYAPPVEHTIVFQTSSSPSSINLFSTDYPQGASGSQFAEGSKGWWDGVGGTHYTVAGLMTSWHGAVSFTAVNPGNTSQTASGVLHYVLDYDCQENGIQVVWDFSSSVTVIPVNLYVDVWSAYAGLGAWMAAAGFNPNETCGADSPEPVPSTEYGVTSDGTPYHTFNYVQSSLPTHVYTDAGSTPYPAGSTAPFPWGVAGPCNNPGAAGFNPGAITDPIATGLPLSATLAAGNSSTLTASAPLLRITNMVDPQQLVCNWPSPPTVQQAQLNPQSGNCPQNAPAAFPLRQMQLNYEHSDQQQGLILYSTNTGQSLIGGQWYMISYMLSSQ